MAQVFGDLATPQGWLNAEMYSIMAPAAVFYVAISSGARAFATESENRSIGLLAANPISRTAIALQKAGATVLHVLIVVVLCGLGTWAGVQAGSLRIAASRSSRSTSTWPCSGSWWPGLAMLLSVLTARRLITMVTTAGDRVGGLRLGLVRPADRRCSTVSPSCHPGTGTSGPIPSPTESPGETWPC